MQLTSHESIKPECHLLAVVQRSLGAAEILDRKVPTGYTSWLFPSFFIWSSVRSQKTKTPHDVLLRIQNDHHEDADADDEQPVFEGRLCSMSKRGLV